MDPILERALKQKLELTKFYFPGKEKLRVFPQDMVKKISV